MFKYCEDIFGTESFFRAVFALQFIVVYNKRGRPFFFTNQRRNGIFLKSSFAFYTLTIVLGKMYINRRLNVRIRRT